MRASSKLKFIKISVNYFAPLFLLTLTTNNIPTTKLMIATPETHITGLLRRKKPSLSSFWTNLPWAWDNKFSTLSF